ncbi:MAG: ERCC4 domain-containing protein [Turicibacter sp.]|nr:ERCC4 domain-containing protein [Turicibacter sp.]
MLKNFKFTDKEIAEIMNNAVILIDTREKDNFQTRLFNEYCASCFIQTERVKLPFGDYAVKVPAHPHLGIMRDLYMPFMIERKANLDELCVNFSSKDRNRFLNEFAKAKASGFTIHVVVESNDYNDLVTGNYRSQFNPNTLEANIWSVQAKYDVKFSYVKDINMAPRFIVNCLMSQLRAELKRWY